MYKMNQMKINTNNTNKLNSAIDQVEGDRCSVRLIDADTIAQHVAEIETMLCKILYKKNWAGLKFNIDPNAQDFPNAYKGKPESTQATVERTASGWFVTELKRDRCCSPTNRIKPINILIKERAIMDMLRQGSVWSN